MNRVRLLAELRRRKVLRVAAAYAVVAWLVIQVADAVLPALELPAWTLKIVVVAALAGFPVAVMLGWVFDITPEGLRRATVAADGEESAARVPPAAYLALAGVLAAVLLVAFATLAPRMGGSAASRERSIAVLPFDNLSPDPDNAFFAAGVHEDVLTQLAMIRDLTVISRVSVLPYAETDKGARQIGQELGAVYILEGSVRRAGGRVRVVAQLIDAATDEHVWAQQYDRDITDLFAVQSELAREIAGTMRAALSPTEEERIEGRPTDNVVAYDLYLRARELPWDRQSTAARIELLRQAIRMDPSFADAHAALADAHYENIENHGADVQWRDSAEALARRAVALAPGRAAGHRTLGSILDQQGRHREGAEHLGRALEIAPGDAATLQRLALLERGRGRHDVALALFRRSLRLQPSNWGPAWNIGVTWHFLRDQERARRWVAVVDSMRPKRIAWNEVLETAIDLEQRSGRDVLLAHVRALAGYPDNLVARFAAIECLAAARETDDALEIAEALYRQAPDMRFFGRLGSTRGQLAVLLMAAGRPERARVLIDQEVRVLEGEIQAGSESASLRKQLGLMHAVAGRHDSAIKWLQAAYDAGERYFHDIAEDRPGVAAADPAFHRSPRLRDLTERADADLAAMRHRAIAAEARD